MINRLLVIPYNNRFGDLVILCRWSGDQTAAAAVWSPDQRRSTTTDFADKILEFEEKRIHI